MRGTHTVDSDFDYRHIRVSPFRDFVNPLAPSPTKPTKGDNGDDEVTYELVHFAAQLLKAAPSALEMLFSTPTTELRMMRGFTSNRAQFVDGYQVASSHLAYATAMMRDAQKGTRSGKSVSSAIIGVNQGMMLARDPSAYQSERLIRENHSDPFLSAETHIALRQEDRSVISEALTNYLPHKLNELADLRNADEVCWRKINHDIFQRSIYCAYQDCDRLREGAGQ